MQKILLLLGGANQPQYQECEKVLKDVYQRTIDEYNLDIEVKSFAADAPDCIADIRLDCDDVMQVEKYSKLWNELWNRGYGDYVIVKTNVSTVLNLKLLHAFINSNHYDINRVYGSSAMYDVRYQGDNYGLFLVGYFLLFHGHCIWNPKAGNDVCRDYVNVFNETLTDEVKRTLCSDKHDLNDDMLLAPCFAKYGFMPSILPGTSIVPRRVEAWGNKELWGMNRMVSVRCKMGLPSGSNEARDMYEPIILKMIGEFYRLMPYQLDYLIDMVQCKSDRPNWKINR